MGVRLDKLFDNRHAAEDEGALSIIRSLGIDKCLWNSDDQNESTDVLFTPSSSTSEKV